MINFTPKIIISLMIFYMITSIIGTILVCYTGNLKYLIISFLSLIGYIHLMYINNKNVKKYKSELDARYNYFFDKITKTTHPYDLGLIYDEFIKDPLFCKDNEPFGSNGIKLQRMMYNRYDGLHAAYTNFTSSQEELAVEYLSVYHNISASVSDIKILRPFRGLMRFRYTKNNMVYYPKIKLTLSLDKSPREPEISTLNNYY